MPIVLQCTVCAYRQQNPLPATPRRGPRGRTNNITPRPRQTLLTVGHRAVGLLAVPSVRLHSERAMELEEAIHTNVPALGGFFEPSCPVLTPGPGRRTPDRLQTENLVDPAGRLDDRIAEGLGSTRNPAEYP